MKEFELIFAELEIFIRELTTGYGPPVSPTRHELDIITRQITNNPCNIHSFHQKNFYLIKRVSGEIIFSFNVDKYLGIEGLFDLKTFHSCVGDGISDCFYLKEYLNWGKSAYVLFKHLNKNQNLWEYSFKIRLPMRCSDGRIYWVLQETKPLEFDKNNNMISHINTYTISSFYHEKEPIGLVAELFYNDLYLPELNLSLAEKRYAVKPFSLSPAQRIVLQYFFENPDSNINEAARQLKYPVNTLKKYISDSLHKRGIIDLARLSFPHLRFRTLKDVLHFLQKIGWSSEFMN